MIIQSSVERFFASIMKRILVSLSCISLVASTGLPMAFAATSHGPSKSKVSAAPKKRVAIASRFDSAVSNGDIESITISGATASSAMPITSPSWSETPTRTSVVKRASAIVPAVEKSVADDKYVAEPETKDSDVPSPALSDGADLKPTTSETATSKTETTTRSEITVIKTEPTAVIETVKTESTPLAETTATTASEVTKTENTTSAVTKADSTVVTTDSVAADTKTDKTGAPDSAQLAAVPMFGSVSANEPIVIDNDEAVEVESTIKYEELPTDEGKTHVKTGAKFPVVISSEITTKTSKKGDPVEARLKYDLKIGDRLIAKKGAVVNGHINYSLPARSTMHSLVSSTRWYRNSGCVGISFDEIIDEKGQHLPLVAVPARAARIVKNKGEGRELGINHDGQVAGPLSQQIRYKAIRIGLNAAMAPAGAFSFGAMPIALGVIGAANPSFAFMKPVGLNVRHRRIKGFFWGALSGVPGSWLIEDTVVKGQEAVIKPGDEFLAEFQQEFTGEPASEASMMPNAKSKVHGQVMPDSKKETK
ncbi:hypothetical protein BH10CYA1_BH10CYA1_49730 [soil metagenome]